MKSQNLQAAGLLVCLLLSGVVAWALVLRPAPLAGGQELAGLPDSIAGWRAIDVAMDQAVSEMLRADANVQRAYFHPQGYSVFVYVGYYGTERGGVPEHTPDICYPAQGWAILSEERLRVGGDDGLWVRELVVAKDEERRLVHYWYRTKETSGITSTLALQLNQFWGRLSANRGDGALVRISTAVLGEDLIGARSKLLAFDEPVDDALADLWPRERGRNEPDQANAGV